MSSPPRHDADGANDGEDRSRGSFLDRRSWGLSHWLWVAVVATMAIAFIPRGARRAIESNTNKAEDWLPDNYAESADLRWFRDHFVGEAFALVSWDGCTLGDTERLRLLEQKLRAVQDEEGWSWYPRVLTGPETIASLTRAPANLERSAALARLEGALVGPPKTGPDGESLGDGSRTTCLIAYLDDHLTANNRAMRTAVERIQTIAHTECGIPLANLHMGGPPVDNVTIDIEGEKTLARLAGLSGIVGLTLSYLCFRSLQLTGMVFFGAVVSAGMSLALVFYYGVVEVIALGLDTPRFGKTDAILMSMPAVVYVLGLSGAIHLVNYYRDERQAGGVRGAVERAVRVAWGPCLLAAFTTAVGLGSLGSSDILPICKFGIFTAAGVVVAVGLLFSLLPVMLHCFPPKDSVVLPKRGKRRASDRPWYAGLVGFVTTRHTLTAALCLLVMGFFAAGLPQIRTSVKLLKLLDPQCDLITDYAWLEANLGNLVPMEVIVALDKDQLRAAGEPAESPDSPRYRMTMFERVDLVRQLQAEVETLGPVSRALSAATFSAEPPEAGGSASFRRSIEFTTAEKLEEARDSLAEYLRPELDAEGQPTGRELWRVSARVTALEDVDYGAFVGELRGHVQPVLDAYTARDEVVALLHNQEKTIGEATVCLLTDTADTDNPRAAAPGTPEARLAGLLRASAGGARRLSIYNVAQHAAKDAETQAGLRERLARYDLVVALRPAVATALTADAAPEESLAVALIEQNNDAANHSGPNSGAEISVAATEAQAVYTGVVPLVYKTQRELLVSLRESIGWATVLIAGVMMVVLRSPLAGLASMIPNVFPIVMVFGALGWAGVKVDIGIMMTASVALGVAVDDTLHFVTWFSRGIRSGLDRQSATQMAFERGATAMTQTTLIAGLGLAVFAVSTFTPTQQFGTLMITMLGAALVGDLVLLPALLCGPLGRFFAPGSPATPEEAAALAAASTSAPAADPANNVAPTDTAGPASPPRQANAGVDEPAVIPFSPSGEVVDAAEPKQADPPAADDPLSSSNAALQAKLKGFRRSSSPGGRG